MIATAILASFGGASFASIPAGVYVVGKSGYLDNPRRTVKVLSFEIAKFETTNAEFKEFVDATGWVTIAERMHNAMVFTPGLKEFRWIQDKTANWRFPNGVSRGGIQNKMDHPVTTISYHDAIEYCRWRGVRLPTLVEWEVASRAGSKTDYFFGDTPAKIGDYANIWHGKDHLKPDTGDPYAYTAPVGKFKPNALGLYDVYGNVFEFCSGRLGSDTSDRTVHARGGSWWCSKKACCYFNSVDIGGTNIWASFSNQGFRVAR